MIYAIGKFGLLVARFAIYGEPGKGPPAKARSFKGAVRGPDCGQPVWLSLEEAQNACLLLNTRDKVPQWVDSISQNAWIPVGVDADWELDTDLMENDIFPTANQLTRACPLIELQQNLPL